MVFDSSQIDSLLFMCGFKSRQYGNSNTANMHMLSGFLACRTAAVCSVPLQCRLLIACHHVTMSTAALHHPFRLLHIRVILKDTMMF